MRTIEDQLGDQPSNDDDVTALRKAITECQRQMMNLSDQFVGIARNSEEDRPLMLSEFMILLSPFVRSAGLALMTASIVCDQLEEKTKD